MLLYCFIKSKKIRARRTDLTFMRLWLCNVPIFHGKFRKDKLIIIIEYYPNQNLTMT